MGRKAAGNMLIGTHLRCKAQAVATFIMLVAKSTVLLQITVMKFVIYINFAHINFHKFACHGQVSNINLAEVSF